MKRQSNIIPKFFFLALLATAGAFGASTPEVPRDTAAIKANAAKLTANAELQKAQATKLIAVADAELARAQAAHHWAIVRYLEDQRRILEKEYREIERAQNEFRRQINDLEWKAGMMKNLRLGKPDETSFEALNSIIAGSDDTEAIATAFDRPVGKLPANNFKLNPYRGSWPHPFPGGDVWDLISFLQDTHLWLVPMRRAHAHILRALGSVTKAAGQQILAKEQAIQAARSARLSEVFQHPPSP